MRRSHDKRSDDATLTPFFCDVCHKSFIIKNQLLEHIKVDHSNKPFILKQSDSKSIELWRLLQIWLYTPNLIISCFYMAAERKMK